ncbi:MAG TPA: helicase-related protein [Tepidisphaeraceae bacterium]|jgi:superfamily II DNA/RNA helicase|nr:helicase-related protein [Tepidisphaeraceae bacterium]
MTLPATQNASHTRRSLFLRLKPDAPEREVAWQEFFDRYSGIISAFGRRLGVRGDDAADLVQDVMLRFFSASVRMSCDSTYLLDHETDFGVKADELATVLDEMYEQPDTKVVIFSQWLRMHELLVRRMRRRKWPHVLFHGGVPGPQRPALVDRFREDAGCRAFLATDAGGVGLNLQHASVVVNMDIPWNPAVMEQRIGRVHRLGQKRPVQVVNFVSKGTIEEGMLSVLKFKKSLFAGALDGGDKEVFLGGSRLTKFIETVEKATSSIPASSVDDAPQPQSVSSAAGEPSGNGNGDGHETARAEGEAQRAGVVAAGNKPGEDVWSALLQTGLTFLEQLATASRDGSQPKEKIATVAGSFVGRDDRTGENYLRIPMPKAEILDKALGAIGALLERFRK